MSELELLRRLAPPVDEASPEVVARVGAAMVAQRRRRIRRAGGRRLLAAPLAATLVAALAIVVTGLGDGREPAWGAEALRMAQASPRLLLDEDGWKVARVDEWDAENGEMTFAHGAHQLELRWTPGAGHRDVVAKRALESDVARQTAVAGQPAAVNRYPGTNDYTAVWLQDGRTVEARAIATSPEAFVALLQGLERVDVDAWLSALPPSAVTPQEHGTAVAGMLEGLPLPPGLDVSRLSGSDETRDRYQLGAQVVGAVACGWIQEWVRAKAAGDDARARQAADALETSHGWRILDEMNAEGDYPEVLWQLADAVATGAPVTGGKPGMRIEDTYAAALGCDVR